MLELLAKSVLVFNIIRKMTLLAVVTSQVLDMAGKSRMSRQMSVAYVYIFKHAFFRLIAAYCAALLRVICCFKHNSNDVFIPESHLVSDYSLMSRSESHFSSENVPFSDHHIAVIHSLSMAEPSETVTESSVMNDMLQHWLTQSQYLYVVWLDLVLQFKVQ